MPTRRFLRRLALVFMPISLLLLVAAPAAAFTQDQIDCSCVYYVRSETGLPGGLRTAAEYTQAAMSRFGYVKVAPRAGAILVWAGNQKGAHANGHMAIIKSARYDKSTKKWTVTVRHTNWPSACAAPHTDTFVWGNLDGVNAYVRGPNRPPDPPSFVTPADASTVVGGTAQLCWTASSDPDGQALRYVVTYLVDPNDGQTPTSNGPFSIDAGSSTCTGIGPMLSFVQLRGWGHARIIWHVSAIDPVGANSDASPCWNHAATGWVDCHGNTFWIYFTLYPGSGQQTTVSVPATAEQGITAAPAIAAGAAVRISAAGSWCTGGVKNDGTASCGPAAGVRPANPGEYNLAAPSSPIGALIGRWGAGSWFYVGSFASLTAPAGTSSLTLACNDVLGTYGDNTGALTVSITVGP